MIDHGVLLNYLGNPNYSWDAPTLTLKLERVPTIVGTNVKLGRNILTNTQIKNWAIFHGEPTRGKAH